MSVGALGFIIFVTFLLTISTAISSIGDPKLNGVMPIFIILLVTQLIWFGLYYSCNKEYNEYTKRCDCIWINNQPYYKCKDTDEYKNLIKITQENIDKDVKSLDIKYRSYKIQTYYGLYPLDGEERLSITYNK